MVPSTPPVTQSVVSEGRSLPHRVRQPSKLQGVRSARQQKARQDSFLPGKRRAHATLRTQTLPRMLDFLDDHLALVLGKPVGEPLGEREGSFPRGEKLRLAAPHEPVGDRHEK